MSVLSTIDTHVGQFDRIEGNPRINERFWMHSPKQVLSFVKLTINRPATRRLLVGQIGW